MRQGSTHSQFPQAPAWASHLPAWRTEDAPRESAGDLSNDTWSSFASSNGKAPRAARVLVVDDEQLIADTLAHILNLSGFVAHAVYSGEAAVSVLRSLCPDIVLTDVRMPGQDGIETGIQIRRQCPQTRVVLFSGQANTNDLIDKASRGGQRFELWPKPIHPRELVKRLRAL